MMRFRELYRISSLMYCVGRDEDSGERVMIVTIPSIAWKDLYFRLTDAELQAARSDEHALDDLAERFATDKGQRL